MTHGTDSDICFATARGFLHRLLGIHWPAATVHAVWFPGCRTVHTLWTRRPLLVLFLSRNGRVLRQVKTRWGRVYRCPRADSVVEIDVVALGFMPSLQQIQALCRRIDKFPSELSSPESSAPELPPPESSPPKFSSVFSTKLQPRLRSVWPPTLPPRGVALLEALLALPMVLIVGFFIVQIALLAYGRLVVGYAAAEAARAAAASSLSASAIDDGLRKGLTPLLGVPRGQAQPDLGGLAAAALHSQWQYRRGKLEGWVDWKILSPTVQTLQDWGQGGQRVVPPAAWATDLNLEPRSGRAGLVHGAPVGRASGQTLLDAGVVKLEVNVGLPLQVPLAGPLLARSLAWWRGCRLGTDQTIGRLRFAEPLGPAQRTDTSWNDCRLLLAPSVFGSLAQAPRLPVKVIALAQTQSAYSEASLGRPASGSN